MWSRDMLKTNAKAELKQSYWLSFGVCIVAGILGGGSSGGSGINLSNAFNSSDNNFGNSGFSDLSSLGILIPFILGIGIFAILVGVAISVFLVNPIEAGKCSFFIRAPFGDRQFANLFSAFKSGRYMSTVKTMFMTGLYIFLWSLLFIIPGIIKSYQYRMVPYIISEDTSLTPDQAMDLSRRMTDGEKWDMFVLDLSFIGWILLSALTLGIGMLFLMPYMEATWAQLYLVLKTKVISPTGYDGQLPTSM